MNTERTHPFGMAISGLDLAQITETQIGSLIETLSVHGVAVIKDQQISDGAFVKFLNRIGSLTFTQGEQSVEGCEALNIVTNANRKHPPRSVFHTDTSYVRLPPAFTALKMIHLPRRGGDTLFTNQYAAYERLSSELKTDLEHAEVLHVATGVALKPADESCHWHPLFRKHPITGLKSLFLTTPERCESIRNTTHLDGQKLIGTLYAHSIRPEYILRHRWSIGDIVIWDNRCTMHRADHSRVIGKRQLHRGLVLENQVISAQIANNLPFVGV